MITEDELQIERLTQYLSDVLEALTSVGTIIENHNKIITQNNTIIKLLQVMISTFRKVSNVEIATPEGKKKIPLDQIVSIETVNKREEA